MSKRDELMKGLGNVRESMGDFESAGAPRTTPAAGPRTTPAHLVGVVRSKDVSQIAIDRIERDPTQPREDFDADALERLAQSLKTRGLLQPLRVRWDAGLDRYVILCGERRWRAARMAGLESLACVIIEGDLSPQERLAVQLVENALREDLRPIEQAK
ncbi:MAG: ParB/RepB/Spo0J family partition protein, partial [Isosphaeraceae bacterium]